MESGDNLIDLRGACIFQGKTLVLNGVDLHVHKGEFVYLIGKTGSGKSSLMKALYGDLPLQQGEGQVVGFDLKKLKPGQVPYLRRKLGIVFQDFQLLMDRTVSDNLIFALRATGWKDKAQIQERINEVLTQVGLRTKGFRFPHELSGGEQQRVAIARALLNHPPLILADEPTGNLDPDTSDDIMQLLLRLNRELHTAVLMATHNYYIIEKFPARIIRCADGKLIEEDGMKVVG
ncbi:MAG: phosphonate ABC transporter ATP-binding protein [Chitinophagales bacterium]|nr:MAG: phosphonate ABC transporter ATP-binding protein [Chitinophagales bacterium]